MYYDYDNVVMSLQIFAEVERKPDGTLYCEKIKAVITDPEQLLRRMGSGEVAAVEISMCTVRFWLF